MHSPLTLSIPLALLLASVQIKAHAQQTPADASMLNGIQWSVKVESFSSEYDERNHNAAKVAGLPNAMPQGGDHPEAWQPKDSDREFIKVAFARPQKIKRVIVLENLNPGSVIKIVAYDPGGVAHDLKSYAAKADGATKRILTLDLPALTMYPVAGIRVEMNTKAVPANQQVDAIGISDQTTPIQLIRLAPDLDAKQKPERLPAAINSASPELGPVISPDGQTLYFSRRNFAGNTGGIADKEDIWYSDFDAKTKQFRSAQNIGAPLNNASYNFISSVTPDGAMLLLGNHYLEGGEMEAGASLAIREAGGWSQPQAIEIKNEKNRSEKVNYFLTTTGRVLLLSAERPDSYGARDLYISFQSGEGQWSEPENLGPVINTAADEYAPFMAADGRTMYFSTFGRPGYGGDDVFIVRRVGDGWKDWTLPENLGRPINTPGNDAYFTLPASGSYAYYTSSGQAGKEDTDIYRMVLPKSQRPKPVVLISGRILDQKDNKPVDAEIIYEDLKTGKEIGRARQNPQTGEYQIALPAGINYGYLARSNNHFSISRQLDLTGRTEYREMRQDLFLAPKEVGAVVRLQNLFYPFDKADLQAESYPELNRVARYLNDNNGLELEIDGHTDSVGTDTYNQQLSQERAQAVISYIVAMGIDTKRLTIQSFGRTKPLATNKTEVGRALNRRVEFKVVKM